MEEGPNSEDQTSGSSSDATARRTSGGRVSGDGVDPSKKYLYDSEIPDRRTDKSSGEQNSGGFSFKQVTILVVALSLVASSLSGGIALSLSSGDSTETVESLVPRPVVSDSVSVSATTEQPATATEVYNQTRPSTVSLYSNQRRGGSSQGSGFIYPGGYIITNYHVIQDTEKLYVNYQKDEWSSAEVVGYDKYTDIAVLRPDSSPEYAEPLPLADTNPNRGQSVYAIGTPNGLEGTLTSGIVSGVERSTETASGFSIPDVVQTDAALNPGNSGGPLVNSNGVVVGVNRAREGENIGYAISARLTEKVANSIIKSGEHEHPYVGIKTVSLTPRLADEYNASRDSGLLVTDVIDDGPANSTLVGPPDSTQNQQVQTGGDIILSIEGRELDSNEDLSRTLLLTSEPGDTVQVGIIRDGERQTVSVTLGDRPNFDSGE